MLLAASSELELQESTMQPCFPTRVSRLILRPVLPPIQDTLLLPSIFLPVIVLQPRLPLQYTTPLSWLFVLVALRSS
jgi:hypothetical protein